MYSATVIGPWNFILAWRCDKRLHEAQEYLLLCLSNTEKKYTVKFLNFWTSENFAVTYLILKKRGQTLKGISSLDANGIANSEDPDQTAPLGAV